MSELKYLQNLHTHSLYSDGNNTCEEIIQQAISLGFKSIGLSDHAYTYFSLDYCVSLEDTPKYIQEVKRLKQKYKGIIDVYLGTEYDLWSEGSLDEYEYVIGSAHYFDKKDEVYSFDYSKPNMLKDTINESFGGNPMNFVKKYFELVSQLPKTLSKMDIVGHFDLILKSHEIEQVIDVNSKEYRGYAHDCLVELTKKVNIFELNTGAIARGLRTTPYPQKWLVEEINKRGCGFIISSDCHYKEKLACFFNEGIEYLKSCGVKEVYTFNGKGFTPQPI